LKGRGRFGRFLLRFLLVAALPAEKVLRGGVPAALPAGFLLSILLV